VPPFPGLVSLLLFPATRPHPKNGDSGLIRLGKVRRPTKNKATEGRSRDLSGILSLETHATPLESPNLATQWSGIRRAAFNRCLTEAPGFLYQLYFPRSWKEVYQFSAHKSTTTSRSLWPDAKETCLRPAEDSFLSIPQSGTVIGSGSGSPPNPPNEIRQNRKRNNRERVNHRAPNVRPQAEAQAHVRSSARNQSGRVNSNCATDECD